MGPLEEQPSTLPHAVDRKEPERSLLCQGHEGNALQGDRGGGAKEGRKRWDLNKPQRASRSEPREQGSRYTKGSGGSTCKTMGSEGAKVQTAGHSGWLEYWGFKECGWWRGLTLQSLPGKTNSPLQSPSERAWQVASPHWASVSSSVEQGEQQHLLPRGTNAGVTDTVKITVLPWWTLRPGK